MIPGNNQKYHATYPPIAATSISPLVSRPLSALEPLAIADMLIPAQNVATEVPTIHPEPVISPKSEWPLDSLMTVLPSEIQSVTPVRTITQPMRRVCSGKEQRYENKP